MIIEELRKLKKNTYSVVADGKSYTFDEEVVLEYRLVKGREITEEELSLAAKKNDIMEYYHKAFDYSLKYGKSSGATLDYLINKGLSYKEGEEIISMLVANKIILDEPLIMMQVDSLVRKMYGRLYIKEKLRERKFSSDLIEKALASIDYEIYYSNMNSLYLESIKKYKGDDYITRAKAKKHLLARGYSFDDLNNLNS